MSLFNRLSQIINRNIRLLTIEKNILFIFKKNNFFLTIQSNPILFKRLLMGSTITEWAQAGHFKKYEFNFYAKYE